MPPEHTPAAAPTPRDLAAVRGMADAAAIVATDPSDLAAAGRVLAAADDAGPALAAAFGRRTDRQRRAVVGAVVLTLADRHLRTLAARA